MPEATINKIALILLIVVILVGLVHIPVTFAHTKGISLSRYGLVDISWTGNLAYVNFSDYEDGFNPFKIGDRHERGLNLTSFDLSLSQDVYQYNAKWALFLAFGRDEAGIEEAFILFHKVPGYLQFKIGNFRANFGKLNQYHDHEWIFGDPPLITTFLLGVDGIHNIGAELNFQPPTPIFTEFSIDIMRGPFDFNTFEPDLDPVFGDADFNDFIVLSRATTFFDLNKSSNLELGVSVGGGRNKESTSDQTIIYGFDWTYQYKPRAFNPYLRWTTEFYWANRENPRIFRFDRSRPDECVSDPVSCSFVFNGDDDIGGMYTEINYRFSYLFDINFRYDYMGIPEGEEDTQQRVTVGLRHFFNPVSRVNFQYEYNAESGDDKAYSTFMIQFNIGGGTVTPGLGKFYNLF
jgi:hypothetical protein